MVITIKAMKTAEEIEGNPEFIGRHGVKLMMASCPPEFQ